MPHPHLPSWSDMTECSIDRERENNCIYADCFLIIVMVVWRLWGFNLEEIMLKIDYIYTCIKIYIC